MNELIHDSEFKHFHLVVNGLTKDVFPWEFDNLSRQKDLEQIMSI